MTPASFDDDSAKPSSSFHSGHGYDRPASRRYADSSSAKTLASSVSSASVTGVRHRMSVHMRHRARPSRYPAPSPSGHHGNRSMPLRGSAATASTHSELRGPTGVVTALS